MKKVAVIGVYGNGPEYTTGQAVKCFELINWLKNTYGEEEVLVVNTHNWKKNPYKLFTSFIHAMKSCKNIILMPAQHGVKVFAPLCAMLNKFYHRSVHYVVIGGWLAEMLRENAFLKKSVNSFDGTYAELRSMVGKLEKVGVGNAVYMPNCRNYDSSYSDSELKPDHFRVCTYSRVIPEKGIEDAVRIVEKANLKLGRDVFSLDVYGKVSKEYEKEFETLMNTNKCASYCGCRNADETAEALKGYFALLFPTYYVGEGFAGTVLDAFGLRLPVIANDWKYNAEIICDHENGMIYSYRNTEEAADCLLELYRSPDLYHHIQNGCMESAMEYSTDRVMGEFIKRLK